WIFADQAGRLLRRLREHVAHAHEGRSHDPGTALHATERLRGDILREVPFRPLRLREGVAEGPVELLQRRTRVAGRAKLRVIGLGARTGHGIEIPLALVDLAQHLLLLGRCHPLEGEGVDQFVFRHGRLGMPNSRAASSGMTLPAGPVEGSPYAATYRSATFFMGARGAPCASLTGAPCSRTSWYVIAAAIISWAVWSEARNRSLVV